MTNLENGFGLGLFNMPYGKSKGFGHGGGIDGFTSLFNYQLENKMAFALVSNGNNFNNNSIALTVLNAAHNNPFEIPVFTRIKLTAEELNQYIGDYTSSEIPLPITFFIKDEKLFAHPKGQPAFPVEPTSKDTFTFDQAGVKLEFTLKENRLIMQQAGRRFQYTKN